MAQIASMLYLLVLGDRAGPGQTNGIYCFCIKRGGHPATVWLDDKEEGEAVAAAAA